MSMLDGRALKISLPFPTKLPDRIIQQIMESRKTHARFLLMKNFPLHILWVLGLTYFVELTVRRM